LHNGFDERLGCVGVRKRGASSLSHLLVAERNDVVILIDHLEKNPLEDFQISLVLWIFLLTVKVVRLAVWRNQWWLFLPASLQLVDNK
jgi:hypothetical protein